MAWGCMSSHGVGRLHIVRGTVKAMGYIEILQNKLLPTARDLLGNQSWIFQDDNAPCHRAKASYPGIGLKKMITIFEEIVDLCVLPERGRKSVGTDTVEAVATAVVERTSGSIYSSESC
ncbi:hypothetical protein TNCV_3206761 [Trichonephila clavipes]|nr:hypothetical protein TNCV_3206761 [Trichonephila clavipes]